MIQSRTKRMIGWMLSCLLVLAVGGFLVKAEEEGSKQGKAAVPAEQVIACIRTAVAAKRGDVLAVESENEGGKTICKVEILAQDGKTRGRGGRCNQQGGRGRSG